MANTKFAFNGINIINTDGLGRTFLANGVDPAWSPDGTKIAFNGINIINVDGSGQTFKIAGGADPAWSPDGYKIAFHDPAAGKIVIINVDGTNQSTLVNGNGLYPTWSPDETKIAFRYGELTGQSQGHIHVINVDGTGQTQLTSSGNNRDPAWSPDGSKIAFNSNRDGNYEIYVMNADGSGQTRLTSTSSSEYDPHWSPDGTKIAFHSQRDGDYALYVMNADGSGQTRLTTNNISVVYPVWSPFLVPADIMPPIIPLPIDTPVNEKAEKVVPHVIGETVEVVPPELTNSRPVISITPILSFFNTHFKEALFSLGALALGIIIFNRFVTYLAREKKTKLPQNRLAFLNAQRSHGLNDLTILKEIKTINIELGNLTVAEMLQAEITSIEQELQGYYRKQLKEEQKARKEGEGKARPEVEEKEKREEELRQINTADLNAVIEKTESASDTINQLNISETPQGNELPVRQNKSEALHQVPDEIQNDKGKEIQYNHATEGLDDIKIVSQLNKCPKCGEPGEMGQRFCKACGMRLKMKCICGTELDIDCKFCPQCGAPLTKELPLTGIRKTDLTTYSLRFAAFGWKRQISDGVKFQPEEEVLISCKSNTCGLFILRPTFSFSGGLDAGGFIVVTNKRNILISEGSPKSLDHKDISGVEASWGIGNAWYEVTITYRNSDSIKLGVNYIGGLFAPSHTNERKMLEDGEVLHEFFKIAHNAKR